MQLIIQYPGPLIQPHNLYNMVQNPFLDYNDIQKTDKFGGRSNTKVQNGIKEYKKTSGLKAIDIKKVSVTIDPNTLTVNWKVTIGPSTDGYTYEQFDSRGSAGGGESAVDGQLSSMHSYN